VAAVEFTTIQPPGDKSLRRPDPTLKVGIEAAPLQRIVEPLSPQDFSTPAALALIARMQQKQAPASAGIVVAKSQAFRTAVLETP
jgi:hypothetical protein